MSQDSYDHIQVVREACIKASPEIAELKAGCLLNLHAGESYGLVTIHQLLSICKKHKKYREECGAEENGCSIEDGVFGTSSNNEGEWWEHKIKISDIKPYQIIGRPIRLADICNAVVERYQDGTLQKEGEFMNITEHLGLVAWNWEHKKDDLTEQSDHCLTFLADLLKQ